MKRRETEEAEETSGAGVIAPIVATAAAIFAFWWLGKYSTFCERCTGSEQCVISGLSKLESSADTSRKRKIFHISVMRGFTAMQRFTAMQEFPAMRGFTATQKFSIRGISLYKDRSGAGMDTLHFTGLRMIR